MSVAAISASPSFRRSPVQCRPATFDDFEDIHALERRYELGFRTYEEWSHLWINNPVWRQHANLPIGWVLESSEGRIVGSIGSVPFFFELGGRQLIAATGSSWVVDERYRGYGLLLLERFLSQPGTDVFLCVSPNAYAQPGIMSQCVRVPTGTWNRAAFWITNYRNFAGSALASPQVRLGRMLQYPLSATLMVRDALRRDQVKAALGRLGRYEIRTCIAVDDRFDEFWEAVRSRNQHRLLANRSREVLEWHFRYPLSRKAAWISTVSDGDRLLAYAVFCRKDVARIGLRRVRLIDYQSWCDEGAWLPPLLADALERCRQDGTAVLESIGWRIGGGDLMDKLAPHFRTLPSWQYFYKAANSELRELLKDRAVWNASHYDGDACI